MNKLQNLLGIDFKEDLFSADDLQDFSEGNFANHLFLETYTQEDILKHFEKFSILEQLRNEGL